MRLMFAATAYLAALWLWAITMAGLVMYRKNSNTISDICQASPTATDGAAPLPTKEQNYKNQGHTLKIKNIIVIFFAAILSMAFLLLPPGNLPALLHISWALCIISVPCLLGYIFFYTAPYPKAKQTITVIFYSTAYLAFFISLSILAYKKGMPGPPGGLDNFRAVSIWEVCGTLGTTGLLLGLTGLMFFAPAQNSWTLSFGKYVCSGQEPLSILAKPWIIQSSFLQSSTYFLWKILVPAVLVTIFWPSWAGLQSLALHWAIFAGMLSFCIKIYFMALALEKTPKSWLSLPFLFLGSSLLLLDAFR